MKDDEIRLEWYCNIHKTFPQLAPCNCCTYDATCPICYEHITECDCSHETNLELVECTLCEDCHVLTKLENKHECVSR